MRFRTIIRWAVALVGAASAGAACLLPIPPTAVAASGSLRFGQPARIDNAPGLQAPAVTGLACASTSQCLGVDGAGDAVSFHGQIKVGGGKTLTGADPGGSFVSVSCPSSTLCFATDTQGHVLSTTHPGASGAWKVAATFGASDPDELGSITCPSAHLCVLIDNSYPLALVSTDPTAGRSTWHTVLDNGNVGGPLQAACPSASLCVETSVNARSGGFYVAVVKQPASKSAWNDAKVGPHVPRGPIACSSSRACAVFGKSGSGSAVTWTTDLGHGWHSARFGSSVAVPTALACPSSRLCLAGGSSGQIARLTLPAGAQGQPNLSVATVASSSVTITSLVCPSMKLCLAGDSSGVTLVDTHPSTGSGQWQTAHTITTDAALLAVTCPTATSCVAGDDVGAILTAPGPAGPWTRTEVDTGHAITALMCLSATQCFAGDSAGQLLSTGAAGPSGAWAASPIVPAGTIISLACPSTTLCLAGESDQDGGDVLVSQDPTDTAPTWRYIGVDGEDADDSDIEEPFIACTAINACASAFFFVDTDASSEGPGISTTSDPTKDGWTPRPFHGGGDGQLTAISCSPLTCVATSNIGQVDVGSSASNHAFTAATIDSGRALTGVDCTPTGRCVAIDGAGRVFKSDAPSGGASTWRRVAKLAGGGQDAIACPTSRSCVVVGAGGRAAVGTATG